MPKEKKYSTPTDDELQEAREMIDLQLAAADAAVGKELEPLVESAALNKLLLKNARQSPAVISKRTGIPVHEVSERLTALLDRPDWRDDLMEEKLLLAEIALLLDDVRERMTRTNVDDEAWAQMVRMQIQIIRTMLEQLEKRRKAVSGELALVNQALAGVFVGAIKRQQDIAIRNIAEKYPDLDTEIIYAEFEDALPEAITYIEARSQDE